MIDKNDSSDNKDAMVNNDVKPDETTHLFVYGNLTIRDTKTREILVNKSF